MGIAEKYNKVAQKITPRWVRNTFMGVALYSQTLNPYAKFSAGVGCFIFVPFNIPGPVDFLFYLSLVVDGAKGSYQDVKKHLNGTHRAERYARSLSALHTLYATSPDKEFRLSERVIANPRVTLSRAAIEWGHDKPLAVLSSPSAQGRHT